MASFPAHELVDKLRKLNNSQQSIETLSAWCCFYRSRAKQVVRTWDDVFKASDITKKLTLLYLVNDIVQNSRRKGPEFNNEFFRILPAAMKHMKKHGDDKVQKSVERLLSIWEERRVFGSAATRSLRQEIKAAETPRKSTLEAGLGAAHTSAAGIVRLDNTSTPVSLQLLQPLVDAVDQVLQADQASRHLAERVAVRQVDLDQAGYEEVAATQDLLSSYVAALKHEVDKRGLCVNCLRGLAKVQDDCTRQASENLQAAQRRLEQASARLAHTAPPEQPQPVNPQATALPAGPAALSIPPSSSTTPSAVSMATRGGNAADEPYSPSMQAAADAGMDDSLMDYHQADPDFGQEPPNDLAEYEDAAAGAAHGEANGRSGSADGAGATLGLMEESPEQQATLGSASSSGAGDDAAALVAALANAGPETHEALLKALQDLPKVDQGEGHSTVLQPAARDPRMTSHVAAGSEEYDPDDPVVL